MSTIRNLLNRFCVLLLAAAAATSALAQPPHAPGGPGGGPAPLALLLLDAETHTALKLTAAQESLWAALQATELTLRSERDAARDALQTLITAQFASGAPDLVAIEDAVVSRHETLAAAGEALSAQAVTLYNSLATGQQAIVIAVAQAHYEARPQR